VTKLHTLTVPDVLWINLQITGAPQPYSYATLEEGTFYQYGHRLSHDLAGQAARFLTGFVSLRPLAEGCTSTAFVGCLAFLEMNGHGLDLDDQGAVAFVEDCLKDPSKAKEAVGAKLKLQEGHEAYGVPDVRDIVASVMERYPDTVAALSGSEAAVA